MHKLLRSFCILLLLSFPLKAMAQNQEPARLLFFYAPGCHRCIEVKETLIPVIEKEFSGALLIEYRDISVMENYKMLLGLAQDAGVKFDSKIPVLYFRGRFLGAEQVSESNLRNFVVAGLEQALVIKAPASVDLGEIFSGFVPLAVIIAGLEDGINPCAFTVLVFFISFLVVQGYRKKELILIGTSFIFAVFSTYLLIGLGIFNFFYRLKGFWLVTRGLNMAVGILSLLLGVLAVYDFVKFKKTGSADGLILQLPLSVKRRIQSVVGFFHRKTPDEKRSGKNTAVYKLVLSAFITGFLVSLLEAVCTGQVYLPTIAFVLKSGSLKLQAFGYLLLYNIMFILPLLAIFVLALMGLTSGDFARFLKKHLGTIKLFMAALFFSLGIFLLWKG
jgi:cytochrome c biogenesis protein CcdA